MLASSHDVVSAITVVHVDGFFVSVLHLGTRVNCLGLRVSAGYVRPGPRK